MDGWREGGRALRAGMYTTQEDEGAMQEAKDDFGDTSFHTPQRQLHPRIASRTQTGNLIVAALYRGFRIPEHKLYNAKNTVFDHLLDPIGFNKL